MNLIEYWSWRILQLKSTIKCHKQTIKSMRGIKESGSRSTTINAYCTICVVHFIVQVYIGNSAKSIVSLNEKLYNKYVRLHPFFSSVGTCLWLCLRVRIWIVSNSCYNLICVTHSHSIPFISTSIYLYAENSLLSLFKCQKVCSVIQLNSYTRTRSHNSPSMLCQAIHT